MTNRLGPSRALRALLLIVVVLCAGFAATALAATPTVLVKDNHFVAKSISVSKGRTVTWRWVGYREHNVTVSSGPARFHSRTQARGTFRHRFTRRGTYKLYCTLHPGMVMTVRVH